MSKVQKVQSTKAKSNKRKKSPDKRQQQQTSKIANNSIQQLFQRQRTNLSVTEIVLSDDSSDFVNPDLRKNHTPGKIRTGLAEKTNLTAEAPNSKSDVTKSWLSAAQEIKKGSCNGSFTEQIETQPFSEDNTDSKKCTTVSDHNQRPCTPVLFESDSDSDIEIGSNCASSSKHEIVETNLQVCVDPYALHLTSSSETDEIGFEINDDVQNGNTDLQTKSDHCQETLEEQELEKMSPKVVVLDGVKKQSTITSFFGGKTSKPALKFVEDIPTAIKQKSTTKNNPVVDNDVDNVKWDTTGSTKTCPFYKKIPGTNFAVDAFSYGIIPGIDYYFLTHFHSDHYHGLNKHFRKPIYCTQVTANLVALKIRVNKSYLRVLPLNVTSNVDGIEVTPVEANHCPGAVMLIFYLPKSCRRILHTGDFRFHHSMTFYKALRCKIHQLFLDTTYLNPSYNFPCQDDIIGFVREVVTTHAKGKPRVLVVTGSYTIGKEKVFMAAAEVLDCCVWAGPEKQKVLNCLEDPDINKRMTTDASKARVHVLPMQQIGHSHLQRYLHNHRSCFDQLLAFKPTGWTHSQGRTTANISPSVQGPVHIYNVPYSEHSSFSELEEFIKFLGPDKVIPTVNVGKPATRDQMNMYIQSWLK